MNKRIILFASALVIGTINQATAGFTDFEDLLLSSTFVAGDSIASGDLSFDVVNFNGTGSTVFVQNNNNGVGTGHELFIGNKLGLDFDLPTTIQQASFEYGGFCCNSGLVINGASSSLASGFSGLDGTTLGGVLISVNTPSSGGNEIGSVVLQGPINSLLVGGVELYIDNVSTTVPEPSTATLAALALLGLLAHGHRSRRTSLT